MALKTVVTSLDGIEEAYHSLYEEKDGKFILQIEGVDDHPAVVSLRNGHANSKQERDEAKRKLIEAEAKLADLPEDFSVEEWTRLKAEDEARAKDPDNKNVRSQIDAATQAIETRYRTQQERRDQAHAAALSEKDTIISNQEGDLRNILVRDGLKAALLAANVKKGLVNAAVAQFEHEAEMVIEDGRRMARMKADLGGETVDKYIANWAQSDAAKDFVEPIRGGDEMGSNRNRVTFENNPYSKTHWNKTQQSAAMKADRSKAEQMAKAAGFKSLEATFTASGPIAA